MSTVVVRNLRIGEGIPKICVPIVGQTEEEILQAAENILSVPADMVEWRVDWFRAAFDIEAVKTVLCKLRKLLGDIPLLFTFRTKQEGGEQEISKEQYIELYKVILEMNEVDLIDVEVFLADVVAGELIRYAHQHGVKVVGSNHDFSKTPDKEEIVRRLCYMQHIGVDIPKIAVMPQTVRDVVTLIEATEEMKSQHADCPIITMSMAGMGAISRVSGEIFGSAVTFGAVNKASAPGQIQAEELKKVLEILHVAR